ncbi:erythrocyte membrane protein 1, PfEMP1, putative [Plasmodium sp.]|nr:erythrocyte membrane protein 1, PfEMP1, putative [Plasmodium sp.]
MGPVRGGDGGGDYIEDGTSKHLLDSIGKIVHDQVKKEAEQRSNVELKGLLTNATLLGESAAFLDPCKLIKDKGDELLRARGHPCRKDGKGEDVKRFSKERVTEYDDKKIKDNKSKGDNNEGDCAPYRRLSLCNKNFQNINNDDSTNAKHNLLLDVCLAAKFEGDSIRDYYPKYEVQYRASGSDFPMCTMLARSFADIGDIVRGRDLYTGNKGKKKKLDDSLKKIFKQIHEGLSNNGVKDPYKGDEQNNYSKLREDWWEANRQDVWKAMTCDVPHDAQYFRGTCGSGRDAIRTPSHCRCENKIGTNETDQVPTYFDYVPQFLRWFEEWGEDFCRKKKKKVENLQKQCRDKGEDGKERYCSRNGYDCTKTKRAIGKYRMGNQCTKCLFACNPYIDWIDNERKQFDKQVKKYQTEILGGGGRGSSRQRRSAHGGSNDNGYEKIFYKKLKEGGYDVNNFLDLLSKEKACQAVTDIEGGKIDFKIVNSGSTGGALRDASGGASDTSGTNDKTKGTFYRSEYCQPCPHCGVKREGKKWEKKNDENCKNIKLYKPRDDKGGTPIEILKSGENHDDIETKLKAFCETQNGGDGRGTSGSKELYQEWKCYKGDDIEKNGEEEDDDDEDEDEVHASGVCILKNEKENKSEKEPNEFQKSFYDFFYYWVAHMLKDSIHWRTKRIKSCINNASGNRCRNGCSTKCDCFLKWVGQKKKEWDKIKEHFYNQQDFKNGGDALSSGVFVLKQILELEFSNENPEEDTENNVSAEEAKEIKHLRDIIKSEETQEHAADITGAEQKTIMDKLIEHEEEIATKCKDCKPPEENRGAGRILPAPAEDPGSDSESDSESEEEPEETAEDTTEDTEDQVEETEVVEETVAEVTEQEGVNPCEIVAELFEDTESLQKACSLKYGPGGKEKFPNWKCIPSGDNSTTREGSEPTSGDKDGAICVPPRRRKLYVTPLTKWANNSGNTVVSGGLLDTDTPISPSDKLRTAFIESAAVETFFLWHKYKKEWELRQKEERERDGLLPFSLSGVDGMQAVGHNDVAPQLPPLLPPPRLLKGAGPPGLVPGLGGIPGVAGVPSVGAVGGPGGAPQLSGIPPGLGMLPGASPEALGTAPQSLIPLSLPAGTHSDDPQSKLEKGEIPPDFLRLMFYTLADYKDILFSVSKDMKSGDRDIFSGDKEMQNIKEKITNFFQNGVKKPGQTTTKPEDWWNENAKHIWNGMICALTYKDSEEKGKPPEMDTTVRDKLWDEQQKKPKGKYSDYEKVQLEEEEQNGAMSTGPKPIITSSSSGEKNPTTLTDFIKRPPYFRYLEEWGEEFCKERKKKLEKIKEECKVEESDRRGQKCSGYGEDCQDNLLYDPGTVSDLLCPGCGRECRKYKKWIETKGKEFEKQKEEYSKQKEKALENSVATYDKKFVGKLSNDYKFINSFLKKLGPCSKTDNESEKGKTIFDEKGETFKLAKHCNPCSEFKIDCQKGNCSASGTEKKCKNNGNDYITANDIGNEGNSTEDLVMRVNDESSREFKDGLNECENSDIFNGFRKDIWECGNVCGYNVCKPKNVNGKQGNGNEIIIIRTLFKRWVEYFLQDYNKIRKILKPCMNSAEGSKCIKDYEKKYICVKQWIDQKRTEWEKIKNHYKKQNAKGDSDLKTLVSNLFSGLYPQTDVDKAIKPCKGLTHFETSCGLNGAESSESGKDGTPKDIVECLLKKLEKKISECQSQHSGEGKQCQEYTPPLDDEEPLEEEENKNPLEAKKNMMPNICEGVVQEPEAEDEGGCDPAAEAPKEIIPEKKVPVPPPKKPEPPPPKVPEVPKKLPEKPKSTRRTPRQAKKSHLPEILGASGFPWTVGIAFAALSYFVLKKKTKASVGNLFQILQIPKGDYDIPTLKSSNRYIPYASDRHKGKTYIYMEGDSSGDEKYAFISDTTDVTSSESEYEELDINDIYVPGSPKYKTLIEVVLEPSKRDTPSSDTPMNKFTDDEWNQLKHDFISNMLQNQPNDVPNDYSSENDTLNTQPNTLYFDKPQEKPFITSIHDRNLYSGEEYSYNVNMVNSMDDIPMSGNNDVYSGIDLINDSLNSNNVDIYDELLKRKENELFGTNHPKHTNTHNVTKSSNSDPIDNQLDLFHTWLDRHRDMCEQWNNKEEVLDKLKEEWNKDNNSGDIPSDSNKTLNTDVSIQIHMDNPKPINQFTNMDTILDDLEKYNEPYYDVQDDIYYDVNDHDASTVDTNAMDVPSKVQIDMDVNSKLVKEKYPIADVWDI